MINWNDIRYFLALSRSGTFVGAAAELDVTHSTVSRRITALEETLGTQLFHRTEKGCRMTDAGEKLLSHAERLERSIIDLEEDVSGRNKELAGSIRICAPDGLGSFYLASRLSMFQKNHPNLNIELTAEPNYYSLAKREIDILITVQKPTLPSVVARRLAHYRIGLFATEKYLAGTSPVESPEDLRKHQIISYIDEFLYDRELRFLEEIDSGLKVTFSSSSVIGQMNATLAGAGIGAIPYFMANNENLLIPVLPELYIDRYYWLQLNQDSRELARIRATIEFLVDQINEEKDLFLKLALPSMS